MTSEAVQHGISAKFPRKTTKPWGSYLPETKILSIQRRYVCGENKSAIAKAEGCDRETVSRIVKVSGGARSYRSDATVKFYGLVPDALEAVRYALQVEKNPTIGIRVLEATGVSSHTKTSDCRCRRENVVETGQERQARMIACVLLEANRNFGVDSASSRSTGGVGERRAGTRAACEPSTPSCHESDARPL